MTRRPLFVLVALGLAALALGGCQTDTVVAKGANRHLQQIPNKTLALMKEKGMTRRDPILVRIYKEDSELEIWKQNEKGRYALLKTYEICRFSGTLGPKKTEGDGQSPEGFYQVSMGQMNPNSQYYLSFNLGFPNAFDRSHGRTGAHLMVHGDCLSKGCYAMTDEQMGEVYALAREALSAGQPSFQVQAFPFRMTADNMARRRNDPNFEFWKNLKEGADQFEVTKLEPKVNVCDRKYVFNADAKDGAFEPGAACPVHEVNPLIASAVSGKQRQDTEKFEKLVSSGLQTAEAYTPQNGRLRRSLKDPIHQPKPAPASVVMTSDAAARTPQSSFALAMADTQSAVPMPVPSPYSEQQEKPAKSTGAFAWLRGGKSTETTGSTTPAAAAPQTASAQTRRGVEPDRAITASLAPTSEEKPFYSRWLGFMAKPQAEQPPAPRPAATRPASSPAPRAVVAPPAPAPRASQAPVPAAQQTTPPAVETQPQAAPSPPQAPASRADAAFQQFGAPQIVNPGSFQ